MADSEKGSLVSSSNSSPPTIHSYGLMPVVLARRPIFTEKINCRREFEAVAADDAARLRADLAARRCPVSADVRPTARQSQSLTHWSVLAGRESPTYQPRAKSNPRAEKRPRRRFWTSFASSRIARSCVAFFRRSSNAFAVYWPCLNAFRLPFGTPGEPPRIRQRPFAIETAMVLPHDWLAYAATQGHF